MEIRGLGNPFAALLGQRPSSETPGVAMLELTEAEQGGEPSSPLSEIVSQYDLHRITPRQFSELLDRLRDADILSRQEHQQLNQLRTELNAAGVGADESVDLLAFLSKKLGDLREQSQQAGAIEDDAQRAALEASIEITRAQSKWLEKLDEARRELPAGGFHAQA